MPLKIKEAHEPIECGVNIYRDARYAEREGPWRATVALAYKDRAAVETDAGAAALELAEESAAEIAGRECPKRCPEKKGTEKPVQPTFEAPTFKGGFAYDPANGYRWVSKATAEYEVKFVCD